MRGPGAPIPVTAGTRLLALLGDPVRHSLSPVFQNAAIRSLGLDGVYLALRTPAEGLPGLIRGIGAAGGGGNVTVPHKEAAFRLLDRVTEAGTGTRACNTFWFEGGLLCGDNTDVPGCAAAAELLLGGRGAIRGARILLLGAGGAARAALLAFLNGGADRVELRNRTPARGAKLLEEVAEGDARARMAPPDAGSIRSRERWDLIVNATSLGLRPEDPLPFPLEGLGRETRILDLVYGPGGGTRWTEAARRDGLEAADGREMLLHQGAEAFARWWGIDPPLAVMREALAGAGGG